MPDDDRGPVSFEVTRVGDDAISDSPDRCPGRCFDADAVPPDHRAIGAPIRSEIVEYVAAHRPFEGSCILCCDRRAARSAQCRLDLSPALFELVDQACHAALVGCEFGDSPGRRDLPGSELLEGRLVLGFNAAEARDLAQSILSQRAQLRHAISEVLILLVQADFEFLNTLDQRSIEGSDPLKVSVPVEQVAEGASPEQDLRRV